MIVWLRKAGVNEVASKPYGCDQRAEVLAVIPDTETRPAALLKVKMCGTGELLKIHPRFVCGVDIAPCLSLVFQTTRIQVNHTNGQLTT